MSAADLNDYNIGQLLDIIFAYQNMLNKDADFAISESEVLQSNAEFVKEMYENGEIEKEEYEEFIKALEGQ